MQRDDTVALYNYPQFTPENFEPWMAFDNGPEVGSKAPSFPLIQLEDRETVELGDVLRRHTWTVLEFGSFT